MSNCKYFKCHDIDSKIFDCSLCYCPFYDVCKSSGSYTLFKGYLLDNGILACEKCTYFHIKENVKKYNELKDNGLDNKNIFNYFIDNIKN